MMIRISRGFGVRQILDRTNLSRTVNCSNTLTSFIYQSNHRALLPVGCYNTKRGISHQGQTNHNKTLLRYPGFQNRFSNNPWNVATQVGSIRFSSSKPNNNHEKAESAPVTKPNEKKNESLELEAPDTRKIPLSSRIIAMITKIRNNIKWVLIRSHNRKFNTDDFSAFISWIITGNVFLLILGTTTFFSLLLYTVNTVFAKEWVAFKIGYIITRNSSLKVEFEEAILPDWRSKKITFKKCFVSLRPKTEDDIGNYTQYDMNIREINIRLNFSRWLSGKGIIEECEMDGIRGEIDRTHVFWEEGDLATNYKNVRKFGDWELNSFKVHDCLVFLKQPYDFRPVEVCIFSMNLNRFRKNWLYYDLLNANYVNGSYDGSLFTVNNKGNTMDNKRLLTRCRIDNLNIDHLNTGIEGPFGWITQGSVDMIGDISIPLDYNYDMNSPSTPLLTKIENLIMNNDLTKRITNNSNSNSNDKNNTIDEDSSSNENDDIDDKFLMDFYIRLNNPKATIPLFSNDISYINNALIRPIIGYINSRKTYIPIRYTIVKDIKDFDGAWTIYDSLLADDLQLNFYNEFVKYVNDDNENKLRIRRIGFWSLQFLTQFILYFLSGYPL